MKGWFSLCLLLTINSVFSQHVFQKYYTFGTWTPIFSVQELPQEGYFFTGINQLYDYDSINQPFNGRSAGTVLKTNFQGDSLLADTLREKDSVYFTNYNYNPDNRFRSSLILPDGNLLAIGETQGSNAEDEYDYDLWLVKYNSALDTQWVKTFSIPDSQVFNGLPTAINISNNRVAVPGLERQFSSVQFKGLLTIFDTAGNYLVHYTIDDPGNFEMRGVCEANDGGFIISGNTVVINQDDWQPLIFKIDSSGNRIWEHYLPFQGQLHFGGNVVRTTDSNYVFAYSRVIQVSPHYKMWHYCAAKYDEQGNQLWNKEYVYSYNAHQQVRALPNNEFMICGWYNDTVLNRQGGYLMKCDANGDSLWWRFYGYPGGLESFMDGQPTSDGGFLMGGESYCCNVQPFFGNTSSMFLVKTDSLGFISPLTGIGDVTLDRRNYFNSPFPNPSTGIIHLEVFNTNGPEEGKGEKGSFIYLFDQVGRQLQRLPVSKGMNLVQIDLSGYKSGQYLVVYVVDGYHADSKKVLKVD